MKTLKNSQFLGLGSGQRGGGQVSTCDFLFLLLQVDFFSRFAAMTMEFYLVGTVDKFAPIVLTEFNVNQAPGFLWLCIWLADLLTLMKFFRLVIFIVDRLLSTIIGRNLEKPPQQNIGRCVLLLKCSVERVYQFKSICLLFILFQIPI